MRGARGEEDREEDDAAQWLGREAREPCSDRRCEQGQIANACREMAHGRTVDDGKLQDMMSRVRIGAEYSRETGQRRETPLGHLLEGRAANLLGCWITVHVLCGGTESMFREDTLHPIEKMDVILENYAIEIAERLLFQVAACCPECEKSTQKEPSHSPEKLLFLET
jgi:hypothetical protein